MPESFLGKIGFILENYGMSFLRGAGYTMLIAVISTLLGCVIGFLVGMVQTIPLERKKKPVAWVFGSIFKFLLNVYVEVFRGTPMMVQAMFIYYGFAMITGTTMNMLTAALLIVSINTGAYMAETVRGGFISIDPGQTEGAKSIGMTHWQTMRYVIIPQSLRNIMPQIGNNLIINIKDTCVLSVIGVVEIFFTMKSVNGAVYRFFETATITMVIYFVLTFVCSRLLRLVEKKLDGPDSYDLATTDTLAYTSGMLKHPGTVGGTDAREGR